MRPSRGVSSSLAVVVALSLAAGCATPPRPKPRPVAEQPAPAPLPPAPQVMTPAAPSLPPDSIGPRAAEPTEPRHDPGPPLPPLAPPPTTPPVAPAQRGKFVVLNFDSADVETVIHAASEIAGFNYVLAPDVRGKVTVQTSGRIPQEDVFGVLLAILEVHGFTAVKAGNLYKIMRIEGARERAVPTIIGAAPDPQRLASDEIITQIVPLRFGSVTDLSNLIRPLISTRGALIAHRETNILIITDTASNVRRLLDIVRLVDVEVAMEEIQIIPVRFADAADLEAILNRLFQSGRLRSAAAGATPAPTPAPVPVQPGAVRPPTTAPGDVSGADRVPLIVAVRRSNSLVVHGRRHELEMIKRLVAQLDVNIYGGRRVFIYYAENAKAKDLAATLNAIYGGKETVPTATPTGSTTPRRAGEPAPPPAPPPTTAPGAPLSGGAIGTAAGLEGEVRFIADETTNSIIVPTFPHNWPEIEATIKQLDRMPRQVLIEVLVAEISLTEDTQLGMDWALREGSFRLAQQSISTATPPTISAPSLAVPPAVALTLPAAGLTAFAFQADKFFAMINALAADSRLNVLSHPHVMTAENKKAVINVSRSVPIITSQQAPLGGVTTPVTPDTPTTTTVVGTQTVEYRDAGVILTVTPRIGEQGTVALDVKQEVNEVGAPVAPTGSPAFIKREAETSVVLVNNQTLVLGGLIQDRRSTDTRGIPWLKDVPILGYLFGTKARNIEKTELLIMITPRVLGTAVDAARITDEMRRTTPELNDAIRRSPRPPTRATPPPPSPPLPPSSAPVVPVPPPAPVVPPPTR